MLLLENLHEQNNPSVDWVWTEKQVLKSKHIWTVYNWTKKMLDNKNWTNNHLTLYKLIIFVYVFNLNDSFIPTCNIFWITSVCNSVDVTKPE